MHRCKNQRHRLNKLDQLKGQKLVPGHTCLHMPGSGILKQQAQLQQV